MYGSKSVLLAVAVALGVAGCSKNKLNIPEQSLGTNLNEVQELNAEGLTRVGKRMEDEGDYISAANFYTDALKRDSGFIGARLGMARILEATGQTAQAAFNFGKALEITPDNVEALEGYARTKILSEVPEDAILALTGYLEEHEGTPVLFNYLGVAYDLESRHSAAENAYRRGLQLVQPVDDPLQPLLIGNLALSMALGGNYSEAIFLLNPYVGDMRLGPKSATEDESSLRQNLALVYALSGNPDAAVEVAKSALSEEEAEFNRTFYEAVAALVGYDRAKAVFLGQLP